MVQVRTPKKFKTYFDDAGRVCTACSTYKLWDQFRPDHRVVLKHTSKCKQCYKEARKTVSRKSELYSAKKHKLAIKKADPFRWKASNIRTSLLNRAVNAEMKINTPSREEIEQWLHAQEPLICYYSREPIKILDITIDHKVPLNRGGDNSFSNLVVASHHMNTAKGTMTDKEFIALLNLISTWEDKGKKLLTRLKQGHF